MATTQKTAVGSKMTEQLEYDEERSSSLSESSDDEQQDLDDAQYELRPPPSYEDDQNVTVETLTASVLGDAPPTTLSQTEGLANPVIIPQRRPRRRGRGFIRAYAPDLAPSGIDQTTFLRFLAAFDKALETSPWLNVINLASLAAIAVPAGAGGAVGFAVQLSVGIYKELKMRRGQNRFLEQMNNELFRPRGLYCLVMTYDNTSREIIKQADMEKIAATTEPGKRTYRTSDGRQGPFEFPAAAQLIFPELDAALAEALETEEPKKQGAFAKKMESISAYFDRKAQFKHLRKNPGSPLYPWVDTSLDRKRKPHKIEKAERKAEKKRARGRKRRLKKNALYLMIVNMPSDAEMEQAVQLMESEAKSG